MTTKPKKLAVINDLSGYGRCALSVSIPVISALGVQACPIPTAILSNHTGFPSEYKYDFTDHMKPYIEAWEQLKISFDGIMTGYMNYDEQVKITAEFIEKFMELSPSTKIYVNSISKPSESRIGSGGYFYKWQDFNQAIEEMCGRIGAEYIDNTYILIEHPDLYAGDGIHVSSDYYPYWLMHMASQARLW